MLLKQKAILELEFVPLIFLNYGDLRTTAQMHAKIATDVAMGRPAPTLDPEWQSQCGISA